MNIEDLKWLELPVKISGKKTDTHCSDEFEDIIGIGGEVINIIHIKRTYEICEETTNIIDMKEG